MGRSRLTGLRREEIAYHAGVSVTWYTWLEQGRNTNPSRQVLDAIALTMRLTVPEHHYVLALAGYAPLPPSESEPTVTAPPHIQRLLEAQMPSPAFALASNWDIAGWNRAYEALYPHIAQVPDDERNLLWLIFTDARVQKLLPEWEATAGRFLAEYRAEAGSSLGTPAHSALVANLMSTSSAFARAWSKHQVERFASSRRRFLHPDVGELTFEQHRLAASDLPDTHVVIYLPADQQTHQRMGQLTRATATGSNPLAD